MKKNIVLSFLALLPLLVLAPRADGALNCSFDSVTGVNFGSYDVFNASPDEGHGDDHVLVQGGRRRCTHDDESLDGQPGRSRTALSARAATS